MANNEKKKVVLTEERKSILSDMEEQIKALKLAKKEKEKELIAEQELEIAKKLAEFSKKVEEIFGELTEEKTERILYFLMEKENEIFPKEIKESEIVNE